LRKCKWKNRTIMIAALFCLMAVLMPMSALADTFTDTGSHWAKDKIESWAEKGYVSGYQDGSFKPDQNITRAEFMVIVNKAFGFTKTAPIDFSDVKDGAWYYDTIAAAKAAGYISGDPAGTMRPDDPITREEAASIIMRLKNLTANEAAASQFTDAALITWSKGAVGAVADAGIMKGYPDGSFQPKKFITRAEAIVALYAAIDYENEKPDTPTKPGEPVTPEAPNVTADDFLNKVYGMTTAMEYKLDDGQWVRYDAGEFAKLDLGGKHTLLVRYAAEGINPAGPATTLRFTSPGGGGGSVAKTMSVTDITAPNQVTVTFSCDVAGASVTWNGEELTGVTTVTGENTITVPAMTSGASNTLEVKKSGYKTFTANDIIWYAPPVISNVSITSSNPLNPGWAANGDIITLTFTANEPVEKLSNFKINSSNPDTFTNDGSNNYTATHLVDDGDPLTGQPVTFQINVVNEHGIYSQTIEATTNGSQVMIIGLAKVSSAGSFGVNGGKVYAGYEYLYEDEPVSLAADKISLIEELEPGQTTFKSLTPDADPLLWFNMEKAAGDYYYMVKTTEGIPYIARLRWFAPETASLNATGGLSIHESITYVEYEMQDAEGAKVSLAADAVKLIAGKEAGQWAALTPNTDSTLWLNMAKPAGEYPFLVAGSDDTIYQADLNWTAPKALEAVATGQAGTHGDNYYVEFRFMDGESPIDLSSYTKLYQIKPDATVNDLGEPNSDTTLWMKTNGQAAGTHTFFLLKDGIWYRTEIVYPLPAASTVIESTGQIGISGNKIYQEFAFKVGDAPLDLSSANVESITVAKDGGEPVPLTPDTDSTLWFNVQKESGIYTYTVVTKTGIIYTADLNWTAPKAAAASATGQAEFDMSTAIFRAEYQLLDGETPIDLSSYTKLYRILPDAEATIEDLGEPDEELSALWFSLLMSEGSMLEGDYTYLLLKDGIWYTSSLPFYHAQGLLEPTYQAGVHEGFVYTAYELMDVEGNPIPLTDANIDYILEVYTELYAGPEGVVVKNPLPDDDPLLWFNVEKSEGFYLYLIGTGDGSLYTAQLMWTDLAEASLVPTGNEGIAPHDGNLYKEYRMLDANDDPISLAEGQVSFIGTIGDDGKWKELEPNTDETLWFNDAHLTFCYDFIVANPDGIYRATLEWIKVTDQVYNGDFELGNFKGWLVKRGGIFPQIAQGGTDGSEYISFMGDGGEGLHAGGGTASIAQYLSIADNASTPWLSLDYMVAGYDPGFDWLKVYIDSDPIASWESDTGGWRHFSYDLSDYKGETIELKIESWTDDALVEVEYYVDNVSIEYENVEITGFDAIPDVNAGIAGEADYADAEEVQAILPADVTANSGAVTVPVISWTDTDGYDPDTAGSYTFTAVLGTIPAGYANTGGYTAEVEVVVAAEPPIILTADTTFNDVDHEIEITFTANADFADAITNVSFNGVDLTENTDYTVSSDKVTLKPAGGNAVLQTPATGYVVISATGYTDKSVEQTITAGAAASIAVTRDPVPGANEEVFAIQPEITIYDQYDNICADGPSSDAYVFAGSGGPNLQIYGNTGISATEGVVNYTDLECWANSPGTGTIYFQLIEGSINLYTYFYFTLPIE